MSNRIYRVMSVSKNKPEKDKSTSYVGSAWPTAVIKLLELSSVNFDERDVFLDIFDYSDDKLALVERWAFPLPQERETDVPKVKDNKDKVEFTEEELTLIMTVLGNTVVTNGNLGKISGDIYNKLNKADIATVDDIISDGEWPLITLKDNWPE